MTPDALMRKVTRAFEKGDLQLLYDAIDDEILWKSASAISGFFRFGGAYRGRSGVIEVMSRVALVYVMQRFEPKEIIASGDAAWGHFEVEAEYLPTKKITKCEIVIRWRVRNDKIIEHESFIDATLLLTQQGELTAPPT